MRTRSQRDVRGSEQCARAHRSTSSIAISRVRNSDVLEFDPLDEYPIHQVALPMRYVGSSDRNVYDRCIYQGVDHEADAYFITGMGVYPNLGVMDAYATVRRGGKEGGVRAAGGGAGGKLSQPIGPDRTGGGGPVRAPGPLCRAGGPRLG